MASGLRLLAVPVLGVFLMAGCGGDADKDPYVQRNVAIVRSLPVFPKAKQLSLKSSPYRDPEKTETDQTTVGFITTVTYSVPKGIGVPEVERFYRRELRRWRLVEAFGRPSSGRQTLKMRAGRRSSQLRPLRQTERTATAVSPIPVFTFDRGEFWVSVNLDNLPYGKYEVVVDHDHYGENKYRRPEV
jgi:hypothetical protein